MAKQKSVVHNVFANGVLNIFNVVMPFIVTPYIYRTLGPVNIGSYEYAMSIFGYFSMLGLLGIHDYGVRAISANRDNIDKRDNIFKNLFVIGLVSNIIILAIYCFSIHLWLSDKSIKIISYILCVNLLSQAVQVEWFNVGMEEFKFITLKTISIRIINIISIFLLIKSSDDILLYALLMVGVNLLNYLVSFYHVIKQINRPLNFFFEDINLRIFIAPLLIILILKNTGVLYTLADRILLGAFTGTENVAFFSLGQKIVELTKALLLSVAFATMPRLSYYLRTDKRLYQSSLLRVIRLIISIGIPTGIGLFILSKEVVMLFGGEKYLPATMAMRVFSIRVIMSCVETIFYSQILFLHGRERRLMTYNFICGIINLSLNLIFIRVLTPFLSIMFTLFSELICNSLYLHFIHFKLKIATGIFKWSTFRYFLICIVFLPIVWIINIFNFSVSVSLLITVPICVATYFGCLALLKDEAYMELKRYAIKLITKAI